MSSHEDIKACMETARSILSQLGLNEEKKSFMKTKKACVKTARPI
jgi:hypothetical protein